MAEIFCAIYKWGEYEDRDSDMVYVGTNEKKARKSISKKAVEKYRKNAYDKCHTRIIEVYSRGKFVRAIDLDDEERTATEVNNLNDKLKHYKEYMNGSVK
jgi:hypothetical protein